MAEWLTGPGAGVLATWVAAGAACVAAFAGVASAIIYWRTFRSVRGQTEISREQFELLNRREGERYLPQLKVEVEPQGLPTASGELAIRVRISNHGGAPLQIPRIEIVDQGRSRQIIRDPGLLVPPGATQEASGSIRLMDNREFLLDLESICEIEAADGRRFRWHDRWNLFFTYGNRRTEHRASWREEIMPPTS
jgi:hypothetical protein